MGRVRSSRFFFGLTAPVQVGKKEAAEAASSSNDPQRGRANRDGLVWPT